MQIIDISLSNPSVTPTLSAVQYDSARECGFFVQEDISSYDIIKAKFTISTGRVVQTDCTVEDHLITFILPLNLTRVSGVSNGVIQFFNSNSDTAIHTFPFKVDVRENPSKDGDTYELAYENMVEENERAESNNTQMESYLDAYGTLTPTQLSSLLTSLVNIYNQFNGQSMTTIGNRLTAMESSIATAQSDIDTLESSVSANASAISTNKSNITALTTRVSTAESDIDTLEGLANNAVYHD